MKKLIDYKGKYFTLQDEVYDDAWDIQIGEIEDEKLTDEYLKNHVSNCIYYGIPAYIGNDKKLKERIEKFKKEFKED